MTKAECNRGASLVEALIAAFITTTALTTMAQLVAAATASNTAARRATVATILAEQKVEQLRALTWAYDAAGLPVDDASTDTTKTPESAGGTGLQPSPAGALAQNTAGFVDHVGNDGQVVGRSVQAPTSAIYTRRWSIEPVAPAPDGALLLQVLVLAPADATAGTGNRVRGDARVATVKSRKAQ